MQRIRFIKKGNCHKNEQNMEFTSYLHRPWSVVEVHVYFNDVPAHDYQKECVLDMHKDRRDIKMMEGHLKSWKEKNYDISDILRKKYTPKPECTFYLQCLTKETLGSIERDDKKEWFIRTNVYLMTREDGSKDNFYVKERLER